LALESRIATFFVVPPPIRKLALPKITVRAGFLVVERNRFALERVARPAHEKRS